MTPGESLLVRVSAAIATSDAVMLAETLDDAAAGADATAVEEVILQSYLFAGYPAALEAMRDWRTRSGLPAGKTAERDDLDWPSRGDRVCATVYGGQYERLRANVAALHPDLERWMVVEGYGKVLGREGLDLRMRELCIVALLISQHVPTQLYAHLRGALNAGASPDDVDAVFALVTDIATVEHRAAAFETWHAVLQRRATGGLPASEA
ncbi:MAG: carboxymuconolactone decarboxylase family protein [Gemmatimonadetes bacterium]|nr:carboxymuconolactone decarboxylase family protein [Gemmatimonadota bacterium]